MKDVNTILKQTIYNLLKPVVNCPLYYQYMPSTVSGNVYVTINAISSIDASTMQSSNSDTSIQIGIYSRDSQANPGQLVNDIAAAIYAVLYPDRQTMVDLSPGFQSCSLTLVNDITLDAIVTNTYVFINRMLTFRFNIFHA